MSWKKVLIERLINQTYKDNFDFNGGFHPFDDDRDHQNWYYSDGNFDKKGLKEFHETKDHTQGKSHRKAIKDDITNSAGKKHKGEDPHGDSDKVQHIVDDCQAAAALIDKIGGLDVFHAVRAKIHHVYDEGIEVGGGQGMYVLGEFFAEIARYIDTELVKKGKMPTGADQRAAYKNMVDKLDLFTKMADQTDLWNVSAKKLEDHYNATKTKGGGQDHTSY